MGKVTFGIILYLFLPFWVLVLSLWRRIEDWWEKVFCQTVEMKTAFDWSVEPTTHLIICKRRMIKRRLLRMKIGSKWVMSQRTEKWKRHAASLCVNALAWKEKVFIWKVLIFNSNLEWKSNNEFKTNLRRVLINEIIFSSHFAKFKSPTAYRSLRWSHVFFFQFF